MSLSLPDGRRGQVLASGLSFALLAAAWTGVVSPALDWYSERQELLLQQQDRLQRVEAAVASLPELTQRAGIAPPPRPLLPGETDAVAGAALQVQVQAMAEGAGARLNSAELLPSEAVGRYRRIALRVAITAPWPTLVELLRTIESAQQQLLVDDLRIEIAPSLLRGAARPLDVSFTLQALRGTSGAASGGSPS